MRKHRRRPSPEAVRFDAVRMRYQAVIFDLFGTLVDNPSYLKGTDAGAGWDGMMESVAAALEIGMEAFRAAWSATEDERYTGSFPTMQAYLEHVCHRAGVSSKPDGISRAVAIRLKYFTGLASPRVDTVATLVRLKDSGHKIGLISDCVLEDALNWPHTPMAPLVDAAVLSCEVGLRKPAPRIYWLACEHLGVTPRDCLYIGDGGSGELTGASQVGMDAVLIRAPYDTRRGDREDWTGVSISTLGEVLDLVAAD